MTLAFTVIMKEKPDANSCREIPDDMQEKQSEAAKGKCFY